MNKFRFLANKFLNSDAYIYSFIVFYLSIQYFKFHELIKYSYFLKILFFNLCLILAINLLLKKYFKNYKIKLFAGFVFLFFYFNYGYLHKLTAFNYYLHKPVVFALLAFLILLSLIFIIVRQKQFKKLLIIANIYYFILLLSLPFYYTNKGKPTNNSLLPPLTTIANKPDIYLIVCDEYTADIALQKRFNYDNSNWQNFLISNNFSIQKNSTSNYNCTDFSMQSFFEMDYLKNFAHKNTYTTADEINSVVDIKSNSCIKFLLQQGYTINNYSYFDLPQNPCKVNYSIILETNPLLANSFYFYVGNSSHSMLYKNNFLNKIFADGLFNYKKNDEKINHLFSAQINDTAVKTNPQFYYVHQLYAHWPLVYNPDGSTQNFKIAFASPAANSKAYLDCVAYANTINTELIKKIKNKTKGNALIIFMGDHGYRSSDLPKGDRNYFTNQNAIYFPDKDYSTLYDSLSNVNIMRLVLNKYFNTRLPLLKDTTIYIEPENKND